MKTTYLASDNPKYFSRTPLWASTLGHGFLTCNNTSLQDYSKIMVRQYYECWSTQELALEFPGQENIMSGYCSAQH